MFCPHCGQQVQEGTNFCPACGTSLNQIFQSADIQPVVSPQPVIVSQPVVTTINAPVVQTFQSANPNDYIVILLDVGNCTKTAARDIFEELLGYTVTQARKLTDNCPIQLACCLSHEQALYICQLLTEYGMSVAVANSQGYIDINRYATSSVFTKSGTLLQKVNKVLATLNAVNQVKTFVRWSMNDPYRFVFRPHYDRIRPPVYARKTPRPAAPALRGPEAVPPLPRARTTSSSKASSSSRLPNAIGKSPAARKPGNSSDRNRSGKGPGGRGPGGFGGFGGLF
ncbi:MAG: hypothetical protein CW338_02870 [Clostridiales bacterium]|nr:hypothetical protein [Clostridiales bacterium]